MFFFFFFKCANHAKHQCNENNYLISEEPDKTKILLILILFIWSEHKFEIQLDKLNIQVPSRIFIYFLSKATINCRLRDFRCFKKKIN